MHAFTTHEQGCAAVYSAPAVLPTYSTRSCSVQGAQASSDGEHQVGVGNVLVCGSVA